MFTRGTERIALVTDTACDLSEEQLARYDIRTVSLRISTSRGELRDRLEISQDELYELLEHELPKTSLPLPADVADLYRSLADEGCTQILHVSMSSGLSGTCNMVRMLAEDAPIPVTVADTMTLSAGTGLLVLSAARILEKGGSVEEAAAAIARLRRSQLGCFVIRTLEFLRKGGRIGLVEGVVGSLLQIKPVISVNDDGVYETLVKGRGFNNAVSAMLNAFSTRYAGRPVDIAVVHGHAFEQAEKLLAQVRENLDVRSAFISPVSPALAIHTGPGLLGIIAQWADEPGVV